MEQRIFKRTKKRFQLTDLDPVFGSAFYLEAVQLVDIDGNFTDWVTLKKFSIVNYKRENLLPVGKNIKEWIKAKKQISDDYCVCLNQIFREKIIPFKQVVALKVRFLGEPKRISHIFHYTPPRP